jgi:hypothetical protein
LLLLHKTDTVVRMSGSVTDLFERTVAPAVADLAEAAMDAVYLGVGAGVLTFQKVQVQRRELQGRLEKLSTQVRNR